MIILLLNAMELSFHYYNNWDLHYLIIIKKPYLHRECFLMKIVKILFEKDYTKIKNLIFKLVKTNFGNKKGTIYSIQSAVKCGDWSC